VTDRVKFLQQDLFKSDISEATVVTLYLLPELNVKLRPQLFRQLKPGTRVVSHDFDMGDWKPDRVVQTQEGSTIYWVILKEIPANLRDRKPASYKSESWQKQTVYLLARVALTKVLTRICVCCLQD